MRHCMPIVRGYICSFTWHIVRLFASVYRWQDLHLADGVFVYICGYMARLAPSF